MTPDAYKSADRLLSDDGSAIEVHWRDGHVSQFPFRYLRGYCPCAMCQGHAAGPAKWQDPSADLGLTGVRLVGNYGISPVWTDGHETGIFADRNLRLMCPCPTCIDWTEDGSPLRLLPEARG
jgi:DUF971 family protein